MTRSRTQKGVTVAADQGADSLPPRVTEEGKAEVFGSVGRTVGTAEYETLRVIVGGTLPCTVDELNSGTAHRLLFGVLRRELREQLERGTSGLEVASESASVQRQSCLEDYPATGTRCSICKGPQYETPGGIACSLGHVVADQTEPVV